MQHTRIAPWLLAVLLAATAPAFADPVGVVKESGRTVRDFFKGGTEAAKRTWNENAARTREDAHEDKEHVKHEAHD